MSNKKDEIKKELNVLIKDAHDILMAELERQQPQNKTPSDSKTNEESTNAAKSTKKQPPPVVAYNAWYSRALPFVRQLVPERYKEFQDLYMLEKRDIKDISHLNYTISDYLLGISITLGGESVVNTLAVFCPLSQFIPHNGTIKNRPNSKYNLKATQS